MQQVTKELKKLVRREAEIDLKARDVDGRPPTQKEVERRFNEIMAEEFECASQSGTTSVLNGTKSGRT
jgi:hypothetical protein